MDKRALIAGLGMSILFTAGYSIGHDRAIRKMQKKFGERFPLVLNAFTSVIADAVDKNLPPEGIAARLDEELEFLKIIDQ